MDAKTRLKNAKDDTEFLSILKNEFKTYHAWVLRLIEDEILTFRVSKTELHPNVNVYRCVEISIVDDESLEFMIETGLIEYIDEYEPDTGEEPFEKGDIEYDNPNKYILSLAELIEHFIDEEAETAYEIEN